MFHDIPESIDQTMKELENRDAIDRVDGTEPLDIIDDPHRLQHFTRFGGPHDHRTATVQIDSHKLPTRIRFHLGVSSPSRAALGHSQASRWEAPLGAGGDPAPSSHQTLSARGYVP